MPQFAPRPTKEPEERENPKRFRAWISYDHEDEIVSLQLRGQVKSRDAMCNELIGEALEARREAAAFKKAKGRRKPLAVTKKVRHANAREK